MDAKWYLVHHKDKLDLKNIPTVPPEEADKQTVKEELLPEVLEELKAYQERLYAENKHGIVVVLQAMDAAGKDGLIKHVYTVLNPQGVRVANFKQPSSEELDRDYLWRVNRALPRRGEIGIFNRSHYEDVIVTRVHNLLKDQNFPGSDVEIDREFWQERFRQINDWERYLYENGYFMLKFFLHVSKEEQAERLIDRIKRPEKNWKFSMVDINERKYWNNYQHVYADMIQATSTKYAPWYILPADKKWYTRYLAAQATLQLLKQLDPQFPELSGAEKEHLEHWQKVLAKDKNMTLEDLFG